MTMINRSEQQTAAALLRWYREMGVEDAVQPTPSDFYSWTGTPATTRKTTATLVRSNKNDTPPPTTAPFPASAATIPADEAVNQALTIARRCNGFADLAAAVEAFDGCPLKAGARNTVFADGVSSADLLVIGEAPGRDEDRIGRPFVGRAGQLLDRMLAAIDCSRERNVLISNVIYWRPPGNRTPTQIEVMTCRPFVDRLIELTAPRAILLVGGAPLQALLGISGIMRARGIWREVETASGQKFHALPTFHPAFLLRQPANKRLAWSDLQSLSARLRDG